MIDEQTLADARALFAQIVSVRGGPTAFTPITTELANVNARLLLSARTCAAGDLSSIVESINAVQSMLPPIVASSDPPIDFTRLSDSEVVELERLIFKARDMNEPVWSPPAARECGPVETHLADVGRWLDERSRGPLDEAGRVRLQNLIVSACYAGETTWRTLLGGMIDSEIAVRVADAERLLSGNKTSPSASPTPAEPTPPPAEPSNILPLRRDTDYAAWRDISGTRRTMDDGPAYTPSGFRCSGDIKETF